MPEPLTVLIIADGEDALRLRKRVGCVARALGIDLVIAESRSDGEPRLFVNGALLIEGLPRTEVIQEQLAQWIAGQGQDAS